MSHTAVFFSAFETCLRDGLSNNVSVWINLHTSHFIIIGTVCVCVCYPDRNDVAGAVHHRQPRVHQHLAQQLDVALMFTAQDTAVLTLQHADGLASPGQQHGGQRRGEDEPCSIGTHRVHQRARTGDVASYTPKRLSCTQNIKKNTSHSTASVLLTSQDRQQVNTGINRSMANLNFRLLKYLRLEGKELITPIKKTHQY